MNPTTPPSEPYRTRPLAIIAFVVVAVVNVGVGLSRIDVSNRDLVDTDGYMRYARILDLVQGRNGWFDGWIWWSNSPYGHSMHWTRPLDAIIVVPAAPLAAFVGWSDAVYWTALAAAVLVHLGLAAAVMWAASPLMPLPAAAVAGMIAGTQPVIVSYAAMGRLDHHVLITLLSVLIVGALVRCLLSDHRWAPILGGSVSAAAVWVSTESLLPVLLALTTLFVVWMFDKAPVSTLRLWTRSLAAGLLVAGFLELGPTNLWTIEYDRISLPYLVLGVAVAVAVEALAWLDPRCGGDTWRRSGLVVAVAVPCVVLGLVAFPELVGGPFTDVPHELWDVWLSKVSESQPTWSGDSPVSTTLLHLGAPLIGLIAACLLAHRTNGAIRIAWFVMAVWIAATAVLTTTSTRFALYPESLAGIPVAAAAWVLIRRHGQGDDLRRILMRIGLLMAAVVGYLALPLLTISFESDEEASGSTTHAGCAINDVARAAQGALSRPADDGPTAVLMHLDLGPEFHVHSQLDVIATPHHRNVDGILDARRIMRIDQALARSEVTQRDIDAILVCPSRDQSYLAPIPADSLYLALVSDRVPTWLREVGSGTEEALLFVVVD